MEADGWCLACPLQTLRSSAGMVVGARPASSLTLPLLLGWRGNIDPMGVVTTSVVAKYAAYIWENNMPLARLQRAWMKAKEQLGDSPSWSRARGPMVATWLSLLRVGWDMMHAHTLRDDLGNDLSLLRYSPHDVQLLLRSGIERWQGKRVAKYLAECCPPLRLAPSDEGHERAPAPAPPTLRVGAMANIVNGRREHQGGVVGGHGEARGRAPHEATLEA